MSQFIHPHTPARPVEDTMHGMILTDNYQWLEDKDNPEVQAWTKAQHDDRNLYQCGTPTY